MRRKKGAKMEIKGKRREEGERRREMCDSRQTCGAKHTKPLMSKATGVKDGGNKSTRGRTGEQKLQKAQVCVS